MYYINRTDGKTKRRETVNAYDNELNALRDLAEYNMSEAPDTARYSISEIAWVDGTTKR